MIHARPAGRRLVAAVTTVLAVTLGATALTAPAIAVPVTEGTVTATVQDVMPFPIGDTISGVTSSGYLTYNPNSGEGGTSEWRWIPADGSAPKELPRSRWINSTGFGDLLGMIVGSNAELVDMATGRTLLSVYVGTGESLFRYAGAADQALFTSASNATGGMDLRMHTEAGGEQPVTGLPADATNIGVKAGTPGHGLMVYSMGTEWDAKRFWGLIDLATGSVTETYEIPATTPRGDVAVSATHFAWVEYDRYSYPYTATIVVLNRSNGTQQRFPLSSREGVSIKIDLVGDWVTYGWPGDVTDSSPNSPYAFTARNLTDGTTTGRLLDRLTSAVAAPDGSLIVRGGTADQGEGLYRIAPGADGVPAAVMVASTGEPTLTLEGHDIPSTIDLDEDDRFSLAWTLSRSNVEVELVLRNTRHGWSEVKYFRGPSFSYELHDDARAFSARNGDYTWYIRARPLDGIGPSMTASGSFKVVREPVPHDYNDNGTPDVLMRDSAGRLRRLDTYDAGRLVEAEHRIIGRGWNIYDRIEAVGDIGGASTPDMVARDKDGVLWEYLGKRDGTFATRNRIGGGWGVYDKIAGGSDLNGDGKADLLATDTGGVLWYYKGTGDWRSPYESRVKIGGGWNIYNEIVATGDIGGAGAGDMVARDKDGVLWLYLGKGDGTFAGRTRVGGGWNAYVHLVGIGDADRDGRPDLLATVPNSTTYFYKGTGDWSAPFSARERTSVLGGELIPTALT